MRGVNSRDDLIQRQLTTERVVRLEVQRRQAKGSLRVIDSMIREVDDQLMYVSQFKKEWLQHRKELETARQVVIAEESHARQQTEEEHEKALKEIKKMLSAV